MTLKLRNHTFRIMLLLLVIGFSTGICHSHGETATILGQVTDEHNNPLPHYTISAVSKTDYVTYAAKTNSGGQFSLTNLPNDTFVVKVRYMSTLLAQREVSVTEETDVTVDFVTKGNGMISGFLLDSISKLPIPITGEIQIGLLTLDEKRVDRIYNGKLMNGYFQVKNLLSGRYQIIDSFDGYVLAMTDSPKIRISPNSHFGGVEVFLKQGASLSGRFVDAESAYPIANVTVRAASEVKDTVRPGLRFAHDTETNAHGEFYLTIPNDPDVFYAFTVIALHPQYQTDRWRWDMSPEKNEYDLGELSLKTFLSLQGKVTASNSDFTVDGLKIQLRMHNKPTDFFLAGAQPEHTVWSDTDGNFIFSGLHPIEYSLTISRNDVVVAYLEAVNPQSKRPLKIHLQKMKTLHGKVVDMLQQPIVDANLYMIRQNEDPHGHRTILSMTQTDTNGAFQCRLLDTKPHLLSMEVSKKGYLAKGYTQVKIGKDPMLIQLQEGFAFRGHVILPRDIPQNDYYGVKVFHKNTSMNRTLNPRTLNKPILLELFPATEANFVLEGLFKEEYKIYVVGDDIAATGIEVKVSDDDKKVFFVANRPTVALKGQVLWTDTEKPVQNALVYRSWYPWELSPYDMSMTLDRFETETDAQGNFTFSNLTQEQYQLLIRVVQTVFEKETETYQQIQIHKKVTLPAGSDEVYPIYLGRADGTPFSK